MASHSVLSYVMRRMNLSSRSKQYLKVLISRQFSTSHNYGASTLYSAICVERHPVITPPRSRIEERFSQMLAQVEEEHSYLSDHEVRHIKDQKAAKAKQENADEESGDAETVTALDLEDKWDAELKAFVAASRQTPADEKNDQKSLDRKLDSSLYLLVKQNIGGKDHWVLPQASWQDGETLRQTAERALVSVSGDIKANVLGNAPCAVARFDPPADAETDKVKVFFYKAWHREGNIKSTKDSGEDYVWVTKEELNDYCHNAYSRHLKKFIFDF